MTMDGWPLHLVEQPPPPLADEWVMVGIVNPNDPGLKTEWSRGAVVSLVCPGRDDKRCDKQIGEVLGRGGVGIVHTRPRWGAGERAGPARAPDLFCETLAELRLVGPTRPDCYSQVQTRCLDHGLVTFSAHQLAEAFDRGCQRTKLTRVRCVGIPVDDNKR